MAKAAGPLLKSPPGGESGNVDAAEVDNANVDAAVQDSPKKVKNHPKTHPSALLQLAAERAWSDASTSRTRSADGLPHLNFERVRDVDLTELKNWLGPERANMKFVPEGTDLAHVDLVALIEQDPSLITFLREMLGEAQDLLVAPEKRKEVGNWLTGINLAAHEAAVSVSGNKPLGEEARSTIEIWAPGIDANSDEAKLRWHEEVGGVVRCSARPAPTAFIDDLFPIAIPTTGLVYYNPIANAIPRTIL